MFNSRRRLFVMAVGLTGALLLGGNTALTQVPTPPGRPPKTTPNDDDGSPANANFPASGNKALLEQRQKDIKKEIEKLFNLVSQLKAEVEKTDATTVLSLAMVKKAEEIERLAKQIKENAKG
jgi:hypothetical protein